MSREDIFDKLESLVLDEEKVVTCKVLSREFKIHVNAARQYLLDFLTIQKTKENISLEASYFLAGVQENDGVKSLKVLVVTQDSLEKAKKKLSEVTSCHIYSVSKGKPNEVVIYNADLSYNLKSHEDRGLLVITHPKIEIKAASLSKINVKKVDSKPPTKPDLKSTIKPQPASVTKNGGSVNLPTNNKEKSLKNKADEVENKKSEITANVEVKKSIAEVKPQKPNSLASLWQKNEAKVKNETSKPEGKGKNKSPQESKKALPKNNIMSMFSKQAEKNAGSSITKTKVSDPIPVKKAEIVSPTKEVESAKSSKSEKSVPSSKSNTKKRKPSLKQTKTSRKHNSESDSDESKPMKKKHRRIAVFDDSDSNSECEDMEAEDKAQRSLWLPEDPIEPESPAVAPTPETDDGEDPIPPTPPVVSHKGRKKISKTVKKTFMDDEGFMVTTEEKEIVSESGSDEDPISTKNSTSKEAPKANQFTYRKQASLTNFFKRS